MDKLKALNDYLSSLGKVAVAFSGGVDSAFLLFVAKSVLGGGVLAITLATETVTQREQEEAAQFCRAYGISHLILPVNLLDLEAFRKNPPDRCYYCKKYLFTNIIEKAGEYGFGTILDGSNADDVGDYRPGMRALSELGVISPLLNLGFTKAEIREYSRRMNLPVWKKPSSACLASRIAYGEEITSDKLEQVETAEEYLNDLGFQQIRVRMHGRLARIEVLQEDIFRIAEPTIRGRIAEKLNDLGFSYVTLDLNGYSTGSMNNQLTELSSINKGAKNDESV